MLDNSKNFATAVSTLENVQIKRCLTSATTSFSVGRTSEPKLPTLGLMFSRRWRDILFHFAEASGSCTRVLRCREVKMSKLPARDAIDSSSCFFQPISLLALLHWPLFFAHSLFYTALQSQKAAFAHL